jgi:lambda family phage tail tape measure protein
MTDVATLGLAVDSSQVEKGKISLDQLSNSAKRAEAAAGGFSASTRNAGAAAASAASGMDAEAVAANRAAKAMQMHAAAANSNVRSAKNFNTANLAAQFQDVAVSAAMGMNALQVGLQQGTQMALVFAAMENPLEGLIAGLGSLFTVSSILAIGLTALAAAGLQMVHWPKLAASGVRALAASLQTIAPYAVAAAAALALLYAPAILSGLTMLSEAILGVTARLAGLAIGFALANPGAAFVVGMIAAVAAANIFRDELTKLLGFDIVETARNAVNAIIGFFVGAYDGLLATWRSLPAAFGDLAFQAADKFMQGIYYLIREAHTALNGLIASMNKALGTNVGDLGLAKEGLNANGTQKHLANPFAGGAADVGNAMQSAIDAAQGKDYVKAVTDIIANGASTASEKLKELAKWLTTVNDKSKKHHGKTDEDKFEDIVTGANNKIAALKAEQAGLGMTEEQALKLKYTQDLLNQAQQKGITLTAAQKAELAGLAGQMASTEVATKKAKEALDFAKDATKGFLSDLRQGLANGEGFWKSFGNAALNVLNKIIDKIEGDLVDALFSASSAGGKGKGGGGIIGAIIGSIGSIFGFASGGYTGRGAASSVAGVVHGGEYVFSKRATDRIGVGNLDAIHKRARGYAGGGHVATLPRVQAPANDRGPSDMNINVTVNGARGNQEVREMVAAGVREGLSKYDKNLPNRINQYNERGV